MKRLISWWSRRKRKPVEAPTDWQNRGNAMYITPDDRAEYERLWSLVPPHGNLIPPVDVNAVAPLIVVVEVDE